MVYSVRSFNQKTKDVIVFNVVVNGIVSMLSACFVHLDSYVELWYLRLDQIKQIKKQIKLREAISEPSWVTFYREHAFWFHL